MDRAFVEQMKKKVEKELVQSEISVITFWKEELEKITRRNTESLSALQQELQRLNARMDNRVTVLKRTAAGS